MFLLKTITQVSSLAIICLFALFSSQLVQAQYQVQTDSLLRVLETTITDKDRVITLIRLCDAYKNRDNTQIEQYANRALSLAKKINYPEGVADAFYMQSATYINSTAFDKSLTLLDSSLQIAEEANYLKGLANVYKSKGYIAYKRTEYEKSKLYHEKALEIARELKDYAMISSVLNGQYLNYQDLGDLDKALGLLEEALIICNDHNLTFEKIFVLTNMGNFLNNKGEYTNAIDIMEEGLKLAKDEGLNLEQGILNFQIGSIYRIQGEYVKALEYYQAALTFQLESDNYTKISAIYTDIAITHYYMGNVDKSIDYFNKGLELNLKYANKYEAANTYNNLGYLYAMEGDYERSLENLDLGLALAKTIQNKSLLSILYGSYGDLYLELKNYEKVIYYLEKSLEISRDLDYTTEVATQLTALSRYHFELEQYAQALNSAEEAIDLASKVSSRNTLKDALGIKAKILAALNRGMQAYETHVAYMAVSDSLFNADKTKAFTRLESDYQFQQEKDSIQFAAENEKLILNAAIESGKARQMATLIGLTAVGLILIVLAVYYYKNRKKNQQLTTLNNEIQNQNIEIKAQRDHLDDLNRVKTKFFSIISHDLRSPLSSFQALSDVIEFNLKQQNYEEIKEINQEVVKRSKEISTLLDNLLSWAVNEEGQFPFSPTTVNIKEAMDEVVNIYLPVATYKNIGLQNMADGAHHVWADANSFKTIIRNLVSNAIKFTAPGGEIILSSKIENSRLYISVSDTGIGLNSQEKKMLFEKEVGEQRGTGTAGEKGVGLGLRLVQDFVKMNNGSISIISDKGKGTRFEISFAIKEIEEVTA